MLVRNTTSLFPDLFLIKLGDTCRYILVRDDKGIIVVDPGATVHFVPFLARIKSLGFDVSNIRGVLLTHAHYDRIAATVSLKQEIPSLEIFVPRSSAGEFRRSDSLRIAFDRDQKTSQLYKLEKTPTFEDWTDVFRSAKEIDDGFQVPLGGSRFVRAIHSPGHTSGSFAYLVFPYACLLTDETFGYFNGSKLATPGGSSSLSTAVSSISKFLSVEVGVLALPYIGALTGSLIRKHMEGVIQNTTDLLAETNSAVADGVAKDLIEQSIFESFYHYPSRDPILQESLSDSFHAVSAFLLT